MNDKNDINDIIVIICMSNAGNSVGPDPRAVVLFSHIGSLHVKISVTLFRLYIGMVTCFRARLCWGGGNVTFLVFPALSVVSVRYSGSLWDVA